MFIQIQDFYLTTVLNDSIFLLYMVSLAVDVITGNVVALSQGKWNSKTGINGSLRHLALLSVMVLLLPMITFATNISAIANGVMLYVITQYTISILENLSSLGMDISAGFSQYFEFLDPQKKEAKQLKKDEK